MSPVNVVRIGHLYDYDKLVSNHVNPAFHGLGHSGWDAWVDGKNPTHVIRFCRKEGEKRSNLINLIITLRFLLQMMLP